MQKIIQTVHWKQPQMLLNDGSEEALYKCCYITSQYVTFSTEFLHWYLRVKKLNFDFTSLVKLKIYHKTTDKTQQRNSKFQSSSSSPSQSTHKCQLAISVFITNRDMTNCLGQHNIKQTMSK